MSQKSSRQAVFDALPGTIPQIVKKTGVCRATVYHWIGKLRAAGACHISSWRRTTGCSTPRYVAGPGVDAPKPSRLTGADYHRKHYIKHRRDVEMEMRATRKAARENAALMAKIPQGWAAALGVREVRHA